MQFSISILRNLACYPLGVALPYSSAHIHQHRGQHCHSPWRTLPSSTSGTFRPSVIPITTTPLLLASSVASGGGTVTVDLKLKQLPFKVANSIAPIPAKLVKKIQALEFVDMRELLPDNIALTERLAALLSGLAPQKPLSQRVIGGEWALVTWVSSFATYIAIIAEAHPERVVDMLAYMRLIRREASKFGGTGWLTYDAVFRRNYEGSTTPWKEREATFPLLPPEATHGMLAPVASPRSARLHMSVATAMALTRR